MFRGLNAVNVDIKGRVAIPTKYRDALQSLSGAELIITIDTEQPCLLLYPFAVWREIESKLVSLPSFNASARRIQRLLVGHATEVQLDMNGRFLLPSVLRDYAGLDKKIMLVGQGNKFEVWAEKQWQSARKQWLADPILPETELPDELKTLAL